MDVDTAFKPISAVAADSSSPGWGRRRKLGEQWRCCWPPARSGSAKPQAVRVKGLQTVGVQMELRLTRVLNARGGRLTLKNSMTELAAEPRGSDRSIAPITSLSVSYRWFKLVEICLFKENQTIDLFLLANRLLLILNFLFNCLHSQFQKTSLIPRNIVLGFLFFFPLKPPFLILGLLACICVRLQA